MSYGMDAGQRAVLFLTGLVMMITGPWMLFRIYPFATSLAMPVGAAGVGGAMAWFWWVIGGFIIPIVLLILGLWLIKSAITE